MKSKVAIILLFTFGVTLIECYALEPFELDEFLSGRFSSRGFNGVWISGDQFYYQDRNSKDVYTYNVISRESTLLFENDVLDNFNGTSFTLSADRNFVLIRYDPKSIYRHSSVAKYVAYDLTERKYHEIAQQNDLQYASWSPTGNSIAYVLDNNIYYVSTPSAAETPIQITFDGEKDVVYNGIPDWVYEEEVLGSGSAIWWSPDGKHIAFGYFNDKEVPEFSYFIYGDVDPISSQYPEVITLRYPKVGARNPDFELKVVNLNNPTNIKSLPILPSGALSKDYVLFDVTWATNNEVVAVVENRVQNEATIKRCSLSETTCETENEFKEHKGWLEIQAPLYNDEGTKYLMLISQPVEDDFYQHLVMFDATTKELKRLTNGKRVVSSISGWDEKRGLIFYSGSREDFPFQQHVYYYNLTSNENFCISCKLLTPEGPCLYASASFSKDFSHLAEICQGPGPNYITLNAVDDFNSAYEYEVNSALRESLAEKLLPEIRDVEVEVPGGFVAKARLLLPPGLDESGVAKYPMVVNVYGGPDSTQISERFSTGFQSYIVTNRRYIYCYIDGRGSGKKGDNMRFQIYKQMGTVEIQDQIIVAKALRDTLGFIDPERIGIWGWSYGGFATAWALVQDVENVFRFGLSVAPVTDFTLYDTIYTERYMGLPTAEDNQLGYNNTDLSRKVENMRDKSFFLIHGNADDNVHYQQSMLLAKALEHADIMFYQMSYPDEDHSLGGVSRHLYHTIDRYWARCFGLPDPQYPKIVD